MNRQRLILFSLVIALIAVSIWSYSSIPRQKTAVDLKFKPGQQAKPAAAAAPRKTVQSADDGTRLNISLLEQGTLGFSGYRRNIFKPVFVEEVKVVKQKVPVFVLPPPKPLPPPVRTEPVVVQPESAPLARFTFLGFLSNGSVKTIFLAKDKDILLVKKGDKIAGRYVATDISDQALTLTVTDTGDEIVIPLAGNRPLGAK
jgi:hypothetical protein